MRHLRGLLGVAVGGLFLPAGAWALEWFNLPFFTQKSAPAAVSATVPGGAEGAGAAPKRPAATSVDVKSARVRVLDKRNNRLSELTLAVGVPQAAGANPGQAGSLNVILGRCVRDVDGVPGQDTAWLKIEEVGGSAPVFEGWMFNLNPDVAAVDHAVYDVRLMGCTRDGQKTRTPDKAAEPTVQLDTTPLAEDTETSSGGTSGGGTAADGAQAQGTPSEHAPGDGGVAPDADPFVVPGVGEAAPAPAAPAEVAPAPADDELQRLIDAQ